jgi:uncharacterized SAM-binding protein YcdF (DUF218 family)
MDPGELKPILAALALPPAGPLLLALLGLLLLARHRRTAAALLLAGVGSLWVLSCHAVALLLAQQLLPQVPPLRPAGLAPVQAVVVLGGGVVPYAPEYGSPQLGSASIARLRYGAWLARRAAKPLGFAGGVGWSSVGTDTPAEADLARALLASEYGLSLTWVDNRSRDTHENAREMARLLRASGVTRVALVTDSWHMPRAAEAFRAAGLEVTPAAMGYPVAGERPLLQWLPSIGGLGLSRTVLREWLALRVAAFTADLP